MNIGETDILVVGAGLAGLSSAIVAAEAGLRVTVLEIAPEDERGGNSRFANGALRAVYHGSDDIADLVGELSEAELARADFGSYSREDFIDHIATTSQYRSDPVLMEILVDESWGALQWLRRQGVRFLPLYEWHPVAPDGRIRFSGGCAVEAQGGGQGISAALFARAEALGMDIRYRARATGLLRGDTGAAAGVEVLLDGRRFVTIGARAVVLAAGGFEANAEWRARYIGPGWDLAKVRGSRFNTGDGLRMAMEAGAVPCGHWSGCHSASWDVNAPAFGDLSIGNFAKRDDFIYGVMVNQDGLRFVDEGHDVRGLTYARLGAVVLAQPGRRAWQIYDSKVASLLHPEYRHRRANRTAAATLEDLAQRLEGINGTRFLEEMKAYNAAAAHNSVADYLDKDGRSTNGLKIDKTNWALPIDEGPFEAYEVTGSITFTFGGVKIDDACRVFDVYDRPIPGLYAAGEMVGGIFYFNYPGGAGLTSAAVFGLRAGKSAAESLLA